MADASDVDVPFPRGGATGETRGTAQDRIVAALVEPDTNTVVAYLNAGLAGLRIAPAALATAALALPVAISAATEGSAHEAKWWFISGAVAAFAGVWSLSAAAYASAVAGSPRWIKPRWMVVASAFSTLLAGGLLFVGVWQALEAESPSSRSSRPPALNPGR